MIEDFSKDVETKNTHWDWDMAQRGQAFDDEDEDLCWFLCLDFEGRPVFWSIELQDVMMRERDETAIFVRRPEHDK